MIEASQVPQEEHNVPFIERLRAVEGNLKTLHPQTVAEAKWKREDEVSQEGTILALELCPIYVPGTELHTSLLNPAPQTEGDIIDSRVGGKWVATKAALQTLAPVFGKANLSVHATFADLGVFVSRRSDVSYATLKAHEDLYRELLLPFCDEIGVNCEFRRLSDIAPTNPDRAVDQFVIASDGLIVAMPPPIEVLLEGLDLTNEVPLLSKRNREKAGVLQDLLMKTARGNVTVFEGLVDTYLNYETTTTATAHLGMERDPKLLSLQTLPKSSRIATLPSLNIQVR